QLGAIETLRQLQHRCVTAPLDIVQDRASTLLDRRVEQAGWRGDFTRALGEIGVTITEHFHRPTRLGEALANVKTATRQGRGSTMRLKKGQRRLATESLRPKPTARTSQSHRDLIAPNRRR